MAFDGTRALIVGDYITPKTGRYAGQLGPWSKVAQAAGIAPRSTLMKSIFVVYGLVYLIVMVAFLLKVASGCFYIENADGILTAPAGSSC